MDVENLGTAGHVNLEVIDAASSWLRFSEELKQDLFYPFSAPEISYVSKQDVTSVRGHAVVIAGGEGAVDMLMTLGLAGSLLEIFEKGAVRPGVRPICQATKLLDRDPIVRRMAEQDLLVMGRAAKPYLRTPHRRLQRFVRCTSALPKMLPPKSDGCKL